jgi:hypothetical protein
MFLRSSRRGDAASFAAADALVARGNLLEAIDVLTDANRRRRDPRIEHRLLALRYRAFPQLLAATTAPPPGPATGEDAFPDVAGLPEVAAGQLTVARLRSAIQRRGSLVVRGLVPRARTDALVEAIDRLFAGDDALAAGRWGMTRWRRPSLTNRAQRRWHRQTGAFLVVDSPATMFDVIETYEEAGLRALVTGYLAERPALLARKWTLRRVPHDAPMGDWHQDGAFMGRDIRSLNVWLSLSHCGADAPGLEIVGRRLAHIVETGTDGAFFDWSVGPGAVQRCSEGSIVRPVFEPGDALFFDHMNLHRTVVGPGMTRDRYAIEAWFLAPSTYPAMIGHGKRTLLRRPKGQVPIVF